MALRRYSCAFALLTRPVSTRTLALNSHFKVRAQPLPARPHQDRVYSGLMRAKVCKTDNKMADSFQQISRCCFNVILFLVILILSNFALHVHCIGEVIYAVNSGGSSHTDLNGVHYQADKLSVGIPSDFGKSVQISRVAPADQILYQTERYHVADFGYNIPIKHEGDFVLVFKFSEVYFKGSK